MCWEFYSSFQVHGGSKVDLRFFQRPEGPKASGLPTSSFAASKKEVCGPEIFRFFMVTSMFFLVFYL